MADVPTEYRSFDFSGLAPAMEMHMREQVMAHLHLHRRAGDDAAAAEATERVLAEDIEKMARLRDGSDDEDDDCTKEEE